MIKKMLLFGCFALWATATVDAQGAGTAAQLDSALSGLHRIHRFNGTVLYAENGKPLLKKAFGVANMMTNEPLRTTSAFNLASVSKQFFGMAMLILSEQQKLRIDDPLSRYIPEVAYPGVTIRHLLTHTSGIPEYFDLFTRYRGTLDTLTNEGLIQLLARMKPAADFVPGDQWAYSNTNYVLLSAIIERVSHEPADAFMRRYIIEPLQLNDTYLYHILMPTVPANHVIGYREENGVPKLFDLTATDGVTGDGNMYSSAEDLLKWEQSWYTDQLVRRTAIQEALTPVRLNDGSTYPYGFGWGIAAPGERYAHTGQWNGFTALIARDVQRKRTLIVLCNNGTLEGVQIAGLIFKGASWSLPQTHLISNVQIIDGTGTPARRGAVRLLNDRIQDVGDLQPYPGEAVTDGGGKVLAPGFIDTHSHLEGSTVRYPEALAALNQGVTTIISGQDGYGSWVDSIQDHIARIPVAINIATYTGHTALRELAMGGEDQLERPATQAETDQMKVILEREMKKGSLGLSTGLEYAGAYFSTRDEVLQLAQLTANEHGRYISHLRSEDIGLRDAIEEIIDIGRYARLPVQISHFKIALKDDWGAAPQLIAQLEAARTEGIDITADCYPYTFWHSTLKVLFPKTDYTNLASAQFAVDHTFDPAESILSKFAANPAYIGKTISEIAAMRGETPAQTIMGLIAESDEFVKNNPDAEGIQAILGKSMHDDDVCNLLAWAHTNICSDGANGGHPRGYGSFTRVLGHYVREKKIMSLETAIYKMTGLAAAQTGIAERGVLANGYYADMVLLDPETVRDNASVLQPKALSDGILKVWVNGKMVYANQRHTGVYSGQFVGRKPDAGE